MVAGNHHLQVPDDFMEDFRKHKDTKTQRHQGVERKTQVRPKFSSTQENRV
jgi:hypothetical protein